MLWYQVMFFLCAQFGELQVAMETDNKLTRFATGSVPAFIACYISSSHIHISLCFFSTLPAEHFVYQHFCEDSDAHSEVSHVSWRCPFLPVCL